LEGGTLGENGLGEIGPIESSADRGFERSVNSSSLLKKSGLGGK